MTKKKVVQMVKEFGLPFAYDHFVEGESPEPPFVVYLYPKSDNFAADGIVYFKKDRLHVELYTDSKDIDLEKQIEDVLDAHGLFYNKSEVWIQSERLYEVLYQTEV